LTPQQAKVSNILCACHTEALGGYSLHCNDCGYHKDYYLSCRNRHCPQCQRQTSQQWLEQRQKDILPVPYFHLVFTLPHELNGWVQLHPDMLYKLFFQVVSCTLKKFGRDSKRLSGELGWTAVLHTWGQNLSQHVHIHCLVPGGAFDSETHEWHEAKSTYLFPVKALSRHVRGMLVSSLRQAYKQGKLPQINSAREVSRVLNSLMQKPWVVFSKPTCNHTDTVLAYLAQYTYRIAMSDRRLIAVDERHVSFKYKDYADHQRPKVMTLPGQEFVRRFLLHILPLGFMRIRHCGFLANCQRRKKLALIRLALASRVDDSSIIEINGRREMIVDMKGTLPTVCPCCHCRNIHMMTLKKVRRRRLR
jgi:hypothetical protein